MAIRLPSYLHRNRYGVFGFRVVIPRDLRLYFSQNEFRMSLSTGERQRARRLAFGLAFYAQEQFQKLRAMNNQQQNGSGFFEDLKSERDRLDEMLSRSADDRIDLDRRADAIAEALSTLGKTQSDLLALAADPEVGENPEHQAKIRQIQSLLDQHLESLRPAVESLAAAEEEFNGRAHRMREQYLTITLSAEHQNVVASQASAFAEEKERLSDFAAEIAAKAAAKAAGAFSTAGAGQMPARDSEKPLSVVIEAYCDNQKAEGNWTPKTEAENRAILALWLRIVGDQPIGGYGYEQHRAYKATLQRLPPNINKSPRYRDKEISTILALGDSPAAPNTINKGLTRIAAIFKWAVEYGYTSLNPASGMTIKNPKRASEERKAFGDDDLRKLFHSKEFLEGGQFPYMRWIPLIALYTGARLNEIAQLHLSDFQEAEGVQVISINDQGEGKRLKTKAGKRLIPIHSELIGLGLIRYVDNLRGRGETRLFPELSQHRDGYGHTVSKWFQRFRKRVGITDEGKVFHSFRHTVIDRLKQAGIPKERIAALVGHEDDSVTFGRYGKDFAPAIMRQVVEALDFPSIAAGIKVIS